MCGIAGVVDFKIPPSAEHALTMAATLRHRGPDFLGAWADGPAAFGHARLGIIDLSAQGNQPMTTADGRLTICYNGEIYNYRELRSELAQGGARFRSQSDTEVLLAAYAAWGPGMLSRLNGIFAFGLWDSARRQLVLVRDRLGVKPLYFHRRGARMVFGSEIKAVLAGMNGESRRVDPAALHEFLFFGTGGLGERTLFQEVTKLPPGTWAVFDGDGYKEEGYWRPEALAPITDKLPEAVARVRGLLEQAVKRQLVSDVPVGVFLSGGIDSSAITAFASRHYAGKMRTFSVGFGALGEINELPMAASVAREFGTEHEEFHLHADNLPEVIEQLVRQHDAPFADAANIPLFLLARQLHGRIKVVLQGDGGDELFAGYRRYRLLAHWKAWRTARFGLRLARFLPLGAGRRGRLERFRQILAEDDPAVTMALLLTQDARVPSPARILGPDFQQQIGRFDPWARYREVQARFAGQDPVRQMLSVDTQILLPDLFLEKVDRATMAHGLEARVPFLDHELVDYAMALPSDYKIKGGAKKYILRAALRGVVPDRVLDAPKKGFSVPYARWLAGPLHGYARDWLGGSAATRDGLLDRTTLMAMLEAHRTGQADHGFLLWKALNLAIWHEFYAGSGSDRFHPAGGPLRP